MSPAASSGNPRLLFQRLGEKWTIPLLGALADHAHRYSEIKRRFPLTSKVLSRTLVALQQDGLVTRVESSVIRRSVAYDLTPAGRRLVEFVRTFDPAAVTGGQGSRQGAASTAAPTQPVTVPGHRPHPPNPLETDLQFRSITIATPDLGAFAARLAPVLGMSPAPVSDVPTSTPDGGHAHVRLCRFPLQGFSVSLAQPLDPRLPQADFLGRHGPGIHHLGFDTRSNLDALTPALTARGGIWTAGGPGAAYAQMDFQQQLGAAIGLSSTAATESTVALLPAHVDEDPAAVPLAGSRELLVQHRVTNVGIVVRSIEDTARAFFDIFGLGVCPIRAVDLALPGVSIVNHGAARIAYLRLNDVALKLIEPTSSGPLTDVLQQHGNRAHHLGFDVGESFSAVLVRLERLGGRVLLGRRDVGYALVDFGDPSGLALELSGAPVHA